VAPPRLILMGRVSGAFGVRGELRIAAYTEDPTALLAYRDFKRKDGAAALTLASGRRSKDALIARAKGVETREAAEALAGLELYLPREALPPAEEDEFYLADLIGLRVAEADGRELGRIKSVQNFGAGDLLEVEPAEGGATWLLPFTREAVPEVRLAEGLVLAVRPGETE
jgi:16S rRNA processing protein RimM